MPKYMHFVYTTRSKVLTFNALFYGFHPRHAYTRKPLYTAYSIYCCNARVFSTVKPIYIQGVTLRRADDKIYYIYIYNIDFIYLYHLGSGRVHFSSGSARYIYIIL